MATTVRLVIAITFPLLILGCGGNKPQHPPEASQQPPQLPQFPNEANEVTLLDSNSLKARVVLKMYGPDSPIEFATAQR